MGRVNTCPEKEGRGGGTVSGHLCGDLPGSILIDCLANTRAIELVGDGEVVFQDYAPTLLKLDSIKVGSSKGVSTGHMIM